MFFLLLRKYGVPANVVEHSRKVRTVAMFLCRELNRRGEGLDPDLVEAGSLLHDIAKVASLETEESHSQAGARLLREEGFAEVAEIVRQHVVLDSGLDHGRITEAALVHYSDKRVQHTRVVSLEDRFRDLRERYGKTPEARRWLDSLEGQSRVLESRIFQKITIPPEGLAGLPD
ncbi:MAG: HDIG domain-containing protein [Syntrophaceae bacterium]|nr:HDIG domain-containing protein [Syntrophaceae bacterium]